MEQQVIDTTAQAAVPTNGGLALFDLKVTATPLIITFDVDAFDASLMPATGTPSPGGLSWREAQFILERCVEGRQVVGLDVVELAPIAGLHHCDFTAAKLTHLLMGLAHAANSRS